jgi:hypothetical protein
MILAAAVVLLMTTALMAQSPQQHDPHAAHGHGKPKDNPAPVTAPKQEAMPAPTSDATQSNTDQQKSHGDAHTDRPTPKTEETKQAEASATRNAADHSSHAGDTGASVKSLMVMSGEAMGVRVGASASNFMPMGQMGSGTAWQPASSPTYMWHKQVGEWLLMFHGDAKVGVNAQGGPRGVTKLESQNWFMPMAYRRVGRGTLQLRGMFSFEPFTFSGPGSPQLFQTGEVYKGEPIIDAQHPHDLFMELSAQYTMPIGERGTWYAYVAPVGEPALGPVAFMHRASASENPSAVLSHHLQDSTHISFGVLTSLELALGARHGRAEQ